MDDTIQVSLVDNTLDMAIITRKPSKGLLWHTDRGSQYASYAYKDLLQKYGITQSMSKKENCWANAVAESFFRTLKVQLVYHKTYKTKAQVNQSIFVLQGHLVTSFGQYIKVFYTR